MSPFGRKLSFELPEIPQKWLALCLGNVAAFLRYLQEDSSLRRVDRDSRGWCAGGQPVSEQCHPHIAKQVGGCPKVPTE